MSMQPGTRILLADVATRAGVSMMTVSRVLNNRPGVSAATRERVLEAAHAAGYVPHAPARGLASGRTGMLGLVFANLLDTYYAEILQGAVVESEAHGRRLVLHLTGTSDAREIAQVATLLGGSVDGLILVLPRAADYYINTIAQRRFPCVLVDHRTLDTPLPAIRSANHAGGEAGTRHLLDLGHRRIGFVTGDMAYGCSEERLAGYRAALAERGITPDERYVQEGDWTPASGWRAAEVLLRLDPRPTAIFASNDLQALGVYEAAHDAGLCVPEQLSVVGFDDRLEARQAYPRMTTVRQPLTAMGGRAVEMVLAQAAGQPLAELVVELPTELVVRASTAAPPAAAQAAAPAAAQATPSP
jgi:LacI family transcriptional regulator